MKTYTVPVLMMFKSTEVRTNVKSPCERIKLWEQQQKCDHNLHGGVSFKLIHEGCVKISEAKKEGKSVLVIGVCNAKVLERKESRYIRDSEEWSGWSVGEGGKGISMSYTDG